MTKSNPIFKIIALSMLLAVLLCAGACAQAAGVTASGACGSNLTWQLDSDGVLTISGSGDMDNCNYDATPPLCSPWDSSTSKILSVIIEEGVTSIGKEAFYRCENLVSVSIPDSVTSIGSYAFQNCSSLTSITLSDGVTSIGERAFSRCSSLESIFFPDNVTSIAETAFYNCSAVNYCSRNSTTALVLTSVYYSFTDPEYPLLSLEAYQDDSGLRTFSVVGSDPHAVTVEIPQGVTKIGGFAFSSDYLVTISIPDSVTSIENYAFSGSYSLESIFLPDNITYVGYAAFDCSGVKYCSLDSTTAVTLTAAGCYFAVPESPFLRLQAYESSSGARTVSVVDCNTSAITVEIPQGVTSIEEKSFQYCSSLESISIPEGVISIGDAAFEDCPAVRYCNFDSTAAVALTSAGYTFTDPEYPYLSFEAYDRGFGSRGIHVVDCDVSVVSAQVPQGVTFVADRAFFLCSNLESISIPDSVASIGESAFSGCSSLKSISIPDSVVSIQEYAFSGCSGLESISIPDGVTIINNCTFSGCSSLKRVSIPNSVSLILKSAFSICSSLESISIPESVSTIEKDAFAECPSLTSVIFPGRDMPYVEQPLFSAPYPVIHCYKLSEVDRWAKINGYETVYLDENIISPSPVLPKKLNMIVDEFMMLDALLAPANKNAAVSWTSSAPDVVSIDNSMLIANAAGTAVITASYGSTSSCCSITVSKATSKLVLPASLRNIYANAFSGISAETVVIPDGCIIIDPLAFADSSTLRLVYMPDSLIIIAIDAFENCSNVAFICESKNAAADLAETYGIPYRIQ